MTKVRHTPKSQTDTTWRKGEIHRTAAPHPHSRKKQSGQRPGPLVSLFFMTLLASSNFLRSFDSTEKGPPALFPPIPDEFGTQLSLIPPPPLRPAPEPRPTLSPSSISVIRPVPIPAPLPKPPQIVSATEEPIIEPAPIADSMPVSISDAIPDPIPEQPSDLTPAVSLASDPVHSSLQIQTNEEPLTALKCATAAAVIATIASPCLNPLASTEKLPPSRPISEEIIIGRRKYTMTTNLPSGTSDEQVQVFKEAFKVQILEKIIQREGLDTTQDFTVSFPGTHAFSVETQDKEPIFFEKPKESPELEQLHSLREILMATSSTKSIPAERLKICWDKLAPVISPAPQCGTSPYQSKKAESPQTNQPTPIKVVSQTVSPTPSPSTITPSQNAPISQTKVPLGLQGGNNNCWANAMLQLLLSSTELSKKIRENKNLKYELDVLHQFYEAYDKRERFDTQRIRKMVCQLAGENQDQTTNTQEDLCEGLLPILGALEPANMMRETNFFQKTPTEKNSEEQRRASDTNQPILCLSISSNNPSIQKSIDEYFTENHDPTAKDNQGNPSFFIRDENHQIFYGTKTTRAYVSAPSELWISLKRWHTDGSKNSAAVEIPHEIKVPLTDGSSQNYKLQAMANHLGRNQHSGHYTAERWIGNQCYLCDDSSVGLMEERLRNQPISSKEAYVLYYEKVITP